MNNKQKFELEFPIQVSPQLLYQYISTPSGLMEWFADDVNFRGEFFTFFWDDTQEQAKLLRKKADELIKFRWVEANDGSYFEFRIMEDEITKDVSLIITDFAKKEELEEAKMLWKNQINDLKHILGCV